MINPIPWRPHDYARPYAKLISSVAAAHGVTLMDILGRSRFGEIMEARRDAVRRVHKAHPRLSSAQLGRIFNRDHTTILYLLGKSAYGRKMGHAE